MIARIRLAVAERLLGLAIRVTPKTVEGALLLSFLHTYFKTASREAEPADVVPVPGVYRDGMLRHGGPGQ